MRQLEGLFVFLLGLVVHWIWSTRFALWGLAPLLPLVLTIAVASRNGSLAGECYGFAWGLFLDMLGMHVFGASALGLTLVGYFVGTLRRNMDLASLPSQLMLVASLTPLFLLFYGTMGLLFEHRFLWVGWKLFLLIPLCNCLVAPFCFALVHRFVRSGRTNEMDLS